MWKGRRTYFHALDIESVTNVCGKYLLGLIIPLTLWREVFFKYHNHFSLSFYFNQPGHIINGEDGENGDNRCWLLMVTQISSW